MKAGRGNSGFTLTEVMVVIAIIGIAVSVAMPSYLKMLPHIHLKAAARDVASAMQVARANAIAKNATTAITFNSTTDSFSYPPVSSRGWSDIDIIADSSGLQGNSADLTVYTPKLDADKVEFKPDGTTTIPDHGARNYEAVYLRNRNHPAEYYRVRVTGITGIVTVQKWTGSAWN